MNIPLAFKLPVVFLKEGKRFVAHSPALDLSTSGKNFNEAQRRFVEAAVLFFEEIVRKGTMEEALLDLGWTKQNKTFRPPVVISQNVETISVPVSV